MTKLILKQNTSTTEQVDSSCIDDLYNLTKNNSISVENGSVIEGKINAPTSTTKKINILHTLDESNNPVVTGNEGEWDNLFVTASTYAIEFEDPNVEEVIRAYMIKRGYGSDMTSSNLAKITSLDKSAGLNSNDTFTTLNDLQYLTGCTVFDWHVCKLDPNVTSIILPPNLTKIVNIDHMYGLTAFRIPSHVTGTFRTLGCNNLQLVVIDGALTTFTMGQESKMFSNPQNVVIRGSVDEFAWNTSWNPCITTFWVPDVEEYKAKTGFSNYTNQIKAISEMPTELAQRVSELQ